MRAFLTAVLLSTSATFAFAGEVATYGEPMPAGNATPISAAIADFDAHAGVPQRFSGRITEVCQAKGCWMMLEDDGRAVRVMFGEHNFYIPKNAAGNAIVYGVLSRKVLSPEAVAHLTEDGPDKIAAAPEEYRIVADGIEISG